MGDYRTLKGETRSTKSNLDLKCEGMGPHGCEREGGVMWRSVVKTLVKLRDPHKTENFLTSSLTASFLTTSLRPRRQL
jgi:hypothetical protein